MSRRARAVVKAERANPRTGQKILLLSAWLLMAALAFVLSRAAWAGPRDTILAEGREEYVENCAGCHGPEGKGGGPLSDKLVKPPTDLTTIAASNGGTFPFWRVFDAISGVKPVPGHDTHQMPEFHKSLKEQDLKPGYLPAHVRLLELTHYVDSIQGK